MRRPLRALALAAAGLAALAVAPAIAGPGPGVVLVQEDGDADWLFNRDASTSSPYTFSLAQRSIGGGSLYVEPIDGSQPADKFIAEQFSGGLVADLSSISYDFLIAGSGDAGDASHFYLNVYTRLPGSTTFYDCRFDYVPTTGSTTAFTTASFAATDTPTNVRARGGATCPTTLSGMPAGSTVHFFSLNVGDTSSNDAGLAGYLDNVVVTRPGGSTTYDFDPHKDACKDGGYLTGGYPNQGQCVAAIQSAR